MLYIHSKTIQKLNRIKVFVMNNKMSFHLVLALLFVAASCKSEVKKPEYSGTEKVEVNTPVVEANTGSDDSDIKEVPGTNEDKETDKEVVKPVKEKKSTKGQSSSTKKENLKKPIVDKGIEIEMGMEETEPKKEVKDPVKEVKIDTKTPVKESKPEAIEEMETEKPSKPERIEEFVGFPNHATLDGLLKAHVSASGVVDYAGLKSKESKLDEYLTKLETNPPGTTWNRNQKLAYWINAYNAYTIKLILKNYPVKSITDLHGGKPWDVKWIKIDGKNLSLNNIENDIIRPKFNEPRIHFAVNCAAKSCPPLLNAAYKDKSLDSQLESQTKKFVNNSAYNTLGKNEITVSKIFDWYGKDFGSVASFVMRYADSTVKPNAKVSFMEYDWALNGK